MAGHLPGDAYWAESDGAFADAAKPAQRRFRVGFTTEARAHVDAGVASCVRDVAGLLEELAMT